MKPPLNRPGQTASHVHVAAGALFLLVATLIAYAPALNGGFLWDDPEHISENAPLRSLAGLRDIWFKLGATPQYYPLTFTGFWIGYHLWGLNPLGFHLLNVFLHVGVAVLLWQVLERLRVRGAFLAGAIFALHPVNVMSVAWMTELKNTLSAGLALASAWAYLRFAGLGTYETIARQSKLARNWRWGLMSLGFFLLAMFAKTAVSFLPVTLLLVVWWQRGQLRWRETAPLLAMLAIIFGMGQVTFHVERLHGASGDVFALGPVERVLVSGRSFWFYLSKLFLPYKLTFIYERWQIDAGAWWQYAFPLATFALLIGFFSARGRFGKGPFVAMLHFYVSTSLLVLIVVLFMTQYTFVSDHWQYFGCMSVIALAAAGIDKLPALVPQRWVLKPVLNGAVLLLLAVLTWRQCGMYRDVETLWHTTLERNPKCWLAHNNLGVAAFNAGRSDVAIMHYQQALAINPHHLDTRINLGTALFKTGRMNEALVHFQKVLEVTPDETDVLNNIGFVFLKLGQMKDALAYLRSAVEHDSQSVTARNNLAWALATGSEASLRNGTEAVALAEQNVRLAGKNLELLSTLAAAYAEAGRFSDAIATAQEALRLSSEQGNSAMTAKVRAELSLYESGLPCRDSPAVVTP